MPGRPDATPNTRPATKACDLSASTLPAFVGIKIGMTYDEVVAVYPEIEKDEHFHRSFSEDGSGLFMFLAKDVANVEAKGDAVQISIGFRDYRSLGPAVVYKPKKWKSVHDAVLDYSKLLGIDETAWTIFYNESAELRCADFNFYVNSILGSKRQNSMSIHAGADRPL